jgi:hypothetical protein
MLPRPVFVTALNGLKIWVEFEDGVEGMVDLSHRKGRGVFKAWDDRSFFEGVHINEETGAVSWGFPKGVGMDDMELDYDPRSLYASALGISFDAMRSMNEDEFHSEIERLRSPHHAGN